MGAGVFASIPNIHGGCRALLFDFDMDYEKAYKAVLKTATQWIKDGCTDKEKICLECVFPELRESEDERIRQYLIEWVSISDNPRKKECLSWLEKQKEQKPAWSEEDQLNLNWVIAILNGEPCDLDIQLESLISWLKSLRPSWKPSEEQMAGLLVAIGDEKERGSDVAKTLRSLYEQLKKL